MDNEARRAGKGNEVKTKRIRYQSFVTVWVAMLMCLGALLAFPRMAQAVPAKDPDAVDPSVSGTCHSQVFDVLTPADLPSNGPTACASSDLVFVDDEGLLAAQEDAPTQSYLPLVVIAIGFDGQPYDDAHDWSDRIFVGERSVSQYYTDMSLGKFTFLPAQETSAFGEGGNTNAADKPNDGVIHVTLGRQKERAWFVYDDEEADRETCASFSEALTQAGDFIDFASYDSNGDGYLQTSELAICFVVAGRDAAQHPSSVYKNGWQYIWPSAWSYSDCKLEDPPAMPIVDGVAIDNYVAIAEYVEQSGSTLVQENIGTLTHELGHYLGLPDLYGTNTTLYGDWISYKVLNLSLMDNGGYGEDLEGNTVPYSLDIWSRVRLGWVEPAMLSFDVDQPVRIAGSLSEGELPIAYQINTPNEGEYYLIENRRFASWDEGMSDYYTSARSDDGGEDLGGGLILWHVDDNIVNEHLQSNSINNSDHHPGVMPLFSEKDEEGKYCTIGSRVMRTKALFDRGTWDENDTQLSIALPLYGTMPGDIPDDRTLSSDLVVAIESASAPVMDLHLHYMNPLVIWDRDCSSATLKGTCYVDWQSVTLDTTTNITSEIVKKPSSTDAGAMAYTARFTKFGREDTVSVQIPPLDEAAVSARDAALAAMTDLITGANAALAQGAYTPESFDALRGAIEAANDLYVDDTTTEEDVAAAQRELIRMWRLLEPVNTYVLDPTEQEKKETHNQAMLDLANLLCQTFDTVDAQAYKPSAYAAYAEVVERAYGVLTNDESTTQELVNARTDVMRALTQLKKNGKRVSLAAAAISGLKKLTYNGKVRKPKPQVALGGKKLVEGTDYKLKYANNKLVGKATVTVVGVGDYKDTASATFTIAKAANTLSAKGRSASVGYAKVKKAAQTLAVSKIVKFSNKGVGKLTFAKVSGNAKIVVNKTTGKLTVKKGLKKGTYKVKIRVQAAGNANYASSKKTVTCTILVK